MKRKLYNIFIFYKKKYRFKTLLTFKNEKIYSYFNFVDNCVYYNTYSPPIESFDEGFDIIWTGVGEIKIVKKMEGYIFILLHEIGHAVDYYNNNKRFEKEIRETNFCLYEINRDYRSSLPYEIRANKFALQEMKRWAKCQKTS